MPPFFEFQYSIGTFGKCHGKHEKVGRFPVSTCFNTGDDIQRIGYNALN